MSKAYPICSDLTYSQFIDTVTAIVQFNADNFRTGAPKGEDDIPEEYVMPVSYVLACWFAQRIEGTGGVETEAPYMFLKMEKHMTWADRRELVIQFYEMVESWT